MPPTKSFEQARLDRIESKIDKLAETVVQMARVEEKIVSMESDKKFMLSKIVRMDERMDDFDQKINENALTVRVINRLFWIIVTAVVAASTGFFFLR